MKKRTIATLFLPVLLVLHSGDGFSQDQDYSFNVKINPVAVLGGPFWAIGFIPITGEYRLSFEATTADRQSAQIGASYLGPSAIINLEELSSNDSLGIPGVNVGGYRVQGMYKFYISDHSAPKGFFLGPHVSYAGVKITNKGNTSDNIQASKLNINGVFGYQVLAGGFVLEIFTGLGYKTKEWNYNDETNTTFKIWDSKGGVNVPLGFNFGYAF